MEAPGVYSSQQDMGVVVWTGSERKKGTPRIRTYIPCNSILCLTGDAYRVIEAIKLDPHLRVSVARLWVVPRFVAFY